MKYLLVIIITAIAMNILSHNPEPQYICHDGQPAEIVDPINEPIN